MEMGCLLITALEESQSLKRRKEIYEAMFPETKKGVAGAHASNKAQGQKNASDKMSFASDTAAKTGKSKRTVERASSYPIGQGPRDCRVRWDMSKTNANRLVDASTVVSVLTPMGVIPTSERQARPLTKLRTEDEGGKQGKENLPSLSKGQARDLAGQAVGEPPFPWQTVDTADRMAIMMALTHFRIPICYQAHAPARGPFLSREWVNSRALGAVFVGSLCNVEASEVRVVSSRCVVQRVLRGRQNSRPLLGPHVLPVGR